MTLWLGNILRIIVSLVCGRARRLFIRTRLIHFGGRYWDWDLTICTDCGWRGPLRWCVHDYQDDGTSEDVEAVDHCPRCGGDVMA